MRRYRFRLERVLRVRRVEEERARAELLRANGALLDAEREVDRRLGGYSTLVPPAGGGVPEYLAGLERRRRSAASVGFAREARAAAESTADGARAGWSTAATRVSSLERLDGRGRDRHAVEARRAEDVEADDVVVGRFAREDRP